LRSATGVRIGAQTVGHSNYFVGRLFALMIGFKEPKWSSATPAPSSTLR